MLFRSKKEMLDPNDLIEIAIQNMGLFDKVKVHKNLQLAAVVAEFNQPEVIVYRVGNTLFEVIPSEKSNSAYFKAFNADTASNFVDNSIYFGEWAKSEGINYLITQFKDKTLLNIFKAINKKSPSPGAGYRAYNTNGGQIRVVVSLGR